MNREAEPQRRALGKGLAALLPSKAAPATQESDASRLPPPKPSLPPQFEEFQSIPLDQIHPSRDQPRENFDQNRLEELAQSIRANGLIQPITVFRIGQGSYQLIAGERRWKAAQLAGLKEIPALVRSVEQHQLLELALIENLQREDLNAIEIATAFERLISDHGLTHEQIAERTGKERSTITNYIRLLRLSHFVRHALASGQLTVGHARVLLNVTDPEQQREFCENIISQQLSVRQTEEWIRDLDTTRRERQPKKKKEADAPLDPNVRAALDEMAMALGTRVRLVPKSPQSGRLEIEYYSQEDLDRIYSVIVKEKD